MKQELRLTDYINPGILDSRKDLAASFERAQPFRHVVMDDFLRRDFCADICAQFPSFHERYAINEQREVGGKATRENLCALGPAYKELDRFAQHPDFLALIESITGIRGLCYDPACFGGGTHENRHGQELDPHIDFNYHPVTCQHRRLNLILYLNQGWQDHWGGSLQLHRDPYLEPDEDEIITISPLLNRCVIFETSEHSWHGFERIDLPEDRRHLTRRSVALYYYTDLQPSEDMSDEHSTVYVQRHLPAHVRPGIELSESDLIRIRQLLKRRDHHLQRLYQEIQNLRSTMPRSRLSNGVLGSTRLRAEDMPSDIRAAARMIRILRQRVDELEASNSWRVTAPFRAAKRKLLGLN